MKPSPAKPAIILIGLLACAAGAAFAAGPARASGTFDSGGLQLKIADAYAFRGASSFGETDTVLVVAVSNQGFVPAAMDEYWDRKRALERYFKDEDTGLVYFEFGLDGKYRGLSYDFGSGIGCGYCSDPAVKSTVSFKNDKLSGKLVMAKTKDSPMSFEITLDVPVSSDDHGAAQGKGGGEPGKAYLAYHKALGGKDPKAIQSLLAEERRARWKEAEGQGSGGAFLEFISEGHPAQVTVSEAFVKGNMALLLLQGKGEEGKVEGEAQLILEQGTWRFLEETLAPASEP